MKKVSCEECDHREQSIIRDMPLDELERFQACGVPAIYKRRQVVFQEGTPATGLYFVCCGAVKLYQLDRFEHGHILHIARGGDVLGEFPLEPTNRYSVSAETLTEAQLFYLPRPQLVEFVQLYPMTGVRLIEAFSRAATAAWKKVRTLALKRAENRMAELLLQLGEALGQPAGKGHTGVTLDYLRRELAEMIGVSTETAIRLLARLRQKQAISADRHSVMIVDADKLARLANHENVGTV